MSCEHLSENLSPLHRRLDCFLCSYDLYLCHRTHAHQNLLEFYVYFSSSTMVIENTTEYDLIYYSQGLEKLWTLTQ